MPKIIYVMDPMCSWCWAFAPVVEAIKQHYPDLEWQVQMGGLAPDSDEPMPAAMRQKLISIWQQIQEATRTEFNFDFWHNNTPRRSTYPACRAVISAEALSPGSVFKMISAIQRAYYLEARNPSDNEVLIDLASSIGLDQKAFSAQLVSSETQATLEQQIRDSYALGAQGFPSLFVETAQGIHALGYGYSQEQKVLERLEAVLQAV